MGKHTDALASLENYRAPWETESGEDAEIDKAKLKRYIHGLASDKAKAQDAREEAAESLAAVQAELDAARDEVSKASPEESNRKIASLQKKVDELTGERDSLIAEKELTELRREVLGDLDPRAAKYVTGTTREELEASMAEVKADFGLAAADADQEDDDEDEEIPIEQVVTTPRSNLRTRTTRRTDAPDAVVDFEAVADSILGTSLI